MRDYSDRFPVEPIIGWATTNYNARDRNGEVQQFQGFKGCQLDGALLPEDYYDREMIAVPEGKFHTSAQFFQPTPEQAIASARERIERLQREAARIEASIERVTATECERGTPNCNGQHAATRACNGPDAPPHPDMGR